MQHGLLHYQPEMRYRVCYSTQYPVQYWVLNALLDDVQFASEAPLGRLTRAGAKGFQVQTQLPVPWIPAQAFSHGHCLLHK
jgi:hypothetical protein